VSLNICHILPKIDELKLYMKTVDIIGISEMFLNENIPDNILNVHNFNLVRKDRRHSGGGGLIVYISDDVTYSRCNDIETDNVESIWIKVSVPNHRPQLLCFVYRVSTQPLEWFHSFEQQIEKAAAMTDEIFILGDMNLDYMKPQHISDIWTDSILPAYNLKQIVTEATRVTNLTSTLIDHIYTSKEVLICEVLVPKIGISDHYPVCCNIKTKSLKASKGHKTIKFRSERNFEVDSFLMDINTINWDACNDNDVNMALSYLNESFLNVINKHAPVKTRRVKYERQPVWFTKEIKEAIEKRNKYKQKKEMVNYRLWRNKVVSLIKQEKANYYKHAIVESRGNSSMMWRYMNQLIGRPRSSQPNALQNGDRLVTDQLEVANCSIRSSLG
jgi:hypothetical protein